MLMADGFGPVQIFGGPGLMSGPFCFLIISIGYLLTSKKFSSAVNRLKSPFNQKGHVAEAQFIVPVETGAIN
jgi:hypothetical protein